MGRFAIVALLLGTGTLAFAAPPREEGEKASDKADKMICKRFLETGSLVKGTRICKTKQEWERGRDDFRQRTNATNGCPYAGASPGC